MFNNNKINITLLTTNKAGILSAMMMKCNAFGLKLTSNKIEKVDSDHQSISMCFDGELRTEKDELIAKLLEHKHVLKVIEFEVDKFEVGKEEAQLDESIPDQILESETPEPENVLDTEPEVDKEEVSFEAARHHFF